MTESTSFAIDNPWQQLRRFTPARIALGRSGASLPTDPQLAFQLAHARARDAVHTALEVPTLVQALAAAAGTAVAAHCLCLHSAAETRLTYLQRPDLGRQLDAASRACLAALMPPSPATPDDRSYDIAFVIGDGLSALAIVRNAVPLLAALLARIASEDWSLAPVVIVQQARVAIGDEIGELLGARLVVMLIGERPGLSSPDSMGLYLTWMPRVGLTDANRNCISNVRTGGLEVADAAAKLHYLLQQARRRQLSGIALKDETVEAGPAMLPPAVNFLMPAPS